MAQNRPDKPQITLPDDFGGTQEPFSSSLVESGYEASIPQIIEGGNLNWMLNGFFQNTKYMRTVLDYVRDTPVGKMFCVNSQGQMDYIQPAIIATNTEFSTGTATDKTPNVKQVVDKFATKADNTSVVHKTGDETIGGMKTFIRGTAGIRISRGSTAYTEIMTTKGDANYTRTGGLRNIEENGINESMMYVATDDGSNISGKISVLRNTTTGDVYTSAPTPSAGDNSTKIATTAFVQTAVNTRATQADINLAVSNVLSALYPVGSLYITTNNSATCPLASLISGSKWSLVAENKALWTSNRNGNTTIAAGLPNITGKYSARCLQHGGSGSQEGAFYHTSLDTQQAAGGTDWSASDMAIGFNARSSNTIYGNSSTVQPPAYRVNVWRRTA